MRYAPHVDGLRGVAVVLVLLFHAKVPGFAGGYVGVDVFFVISGYLISSLILDEKARGRFTLLGFYERRIRRIFPALFLVVLSTLAIGAFVMLPADLAHLGASSVATVFFLSNVYFWRREQDYLHGDLEMEPLVHTWSLAIEEQFYLLFPLFVLAVIRFLKRPRIAFVAVALGSFALSVYLVATRPQAAFYLPASRAWELLLGACVALSGPKAVMPRPLAPALQVVGLAMIVGAAWSVDGHTPFPGVAALPPCLGTALILSSGDARSPLVRALGQPTLVWVGLISYTLYLWHWPLLVLAKLALSRELAGHEIAALYVLAIVLAHGTWRYIERPIRQRNGPISAKRVFALAAGVSCLTVAIGGSLRASEGIWAATPARVVQVLRAANDYAPLTGTCHNWDRKRPQELSRCLIGARGREAVDFALWGDSHAGAIANAVATAASSVGKQGLQTTSDDCPPLLRTQVRIQRVATDCEARNEATFALLRKHHVRQVILAGAWIQYLGESKVLTPAGEPSGTGDHVASLRRSLADTVGELRALGIDVVIVGPVPYIGWNVPSVLATAEWHRAVLPEGPSLRDFLTSERAVLTILKTLEDDGVHVVYPHEVLCRSTCKVRLEGRILYRDKEHLTTAGAALLQPMLVQQLSRTLPAP